MVKHQRELEARETQILVISFDAPESINTFKSLLQLPLTVASDESHSAYRAYGLTRGSFFQIWHPKTILRYTKLIGRGMKMRRAERGQDLSQLGGDFVIDHESHIHFSHASLRPDDRPPIRALLDALASCPTSAQHLR